MACNFCETYCLSIILSGGTITTPNPNITTSHTELGVLKYSISVLIIKANEMHYFSSLF